MHTKSTKKTLANINTRFLFVVFAIAGLLLAMLIATVDYRYGSITTAMKIASGHQIFSSESSRSFGRVRKGWDGTIRFTLSNHSSTPARIVGASSSCSCTYAESLPIEIEPYSSVEFKVHIKTSTKIGEVHEQVILYTSDSLQPTIILKISGVVWSEADALSKAGVTSH